MGPGSCFVAEVIEFLIGCQPVFVGTVVKLGQSIECRQVPGMQGFVDGGQQSLFALLAFLWCSQEPGPERREWADIWWNAEAGAVLYFAEPAANCRQEGEWTVIEYDDVGIDVGEDAIPAI
jgi:hypothetical protein